MATDARRVAVFLAFVGALAFGCQSHEKAVYERIARELNPLLSVMKPVAVKLMALKVEDEPAVVEACTSVDPTLWAFRNVKLDDEFTNNPRKLPPPTLYAEFLLDERSKFCGRSLPTDKRDLCSWWCLQHWPALVASVEELRERAKSEGVDIISLKP
jgi:hypothetical protein